MSKTLSVVELSYRHFATVVLQEPIDWTQNPFNSRNWVHHFLSLRWLRGANEFECRLIISSFIDWVNSRETNRNYLSGRKFDHTTAVRVQVLSELQNLLNDPSLEERVQSEIELELDELVFSGIYKLGHNHGLLVDLAVLSVVASQTWTANDKGRWLPTVFERILKQIDSLYDEEGFSLEHSVSYQEFNLRTLEAISGLVKEHFSDFIHPNTLTERIASIRITSKLLLGAALRANGQYIPFGDSFRLPNRHVLEEVYGSSDPFVALSDNGELPISCVASKAGLGFIRSSWASAQWHIGITSAHNLPSHKQSDELALFVEHSGQIVFDDSAYTDADDKVRAFCRTRLAHSTFSMLDDDSNLVRRTVITPNERWVRLLQLGEYEGLIAQARYPDGNVLWRVILILPECSLCVVDWQDYDHRNNERLFHRFIFGDQISPIISKGKVILEGCALKMFADISLPAPVKSKVLVAGMNKSIPETREVLDWHNQSDLAVYQLTNCNAPDRRISAARLGDDISVVSAGDIELSFLLPVAIIKQLWNECPVVLEIEAT